MLTRWATIAICNLVYDKTNHTRRCDGCGWAKVPCACSKFGNSNPNLPDWLSAGEGNINSSRIIHTVNEVDNLLLSVNIFFCFWRMLRDTQLFSAQASRSFILLYFMSLTPQLWVRAYLKNIDAVVAAVKTKQVQKISWCRFTIPSVTCGYEKGKLT